MTKLFETVIDARHSNPPGTPTGSQASSGNATPPGTRGTTANSPGHRGGISTTATGRKFHNRVSEIALGFSKHPLYPNLTVCLNGLFSFDFPIDEILDPIGSNFANAAAVCKIYRV